MHIATRKQTASSLENGTPLSALEMGNWNVYTLLCAQPDNTDTVSNYKLRKQSICQKHIFPTRTTSFSYEMSDLENLLRRTGLSIGSMLCNQCCTLRRGLVIWKTKTSRYPYYNHRIKNLNSNETLRNSVI